MMSQGSRPVAEAAQEEKDSRPRLLEDRGDPYRRRVTFGYRDPPKNDNDNDNDDRRRRGFFS
jgi:hypothetical protein